MVVECWITVDREVTKVVSNTGDGGESVVLRQSGGVVEVIVDGSADERGVPAIEYGVEV
jgi:hypothetical protein